MPAASPASACERGKGFTTKGAESRAQRAQRVIAAGFLAGVDGRGFSLESGGKTAALQSAAVAAVGKGERTQRGTVLGAIGGHGSLQKERLDLGFLGSLAEARRISERKQSSRVTIAVSIKFR